jgi:predicted DNA-binding transcriptional regulator YafY
MANYKHDYDKTLYRLITILTKLNNGDKLSVKELAEKFNVSTRTIQRDFNERLTSYPIFLQNKKWQMDKGFKLEKTNDVEEIVVLDIIEKIVEGIGGNFATKSKYLLSKIKNDNFNPIYTKLNIEDISDRMLDIASIETNIKEKIIISFNYVYNGRISKIKIKPLKIVNFEGFWYLIALDIRNDELKKYYFRNISSIKATNISFDTNLEIENLLDNSISIWFSQNTKPFEVVLSADKIASKYFQRKPLPTQQLLSSYEDGSMEFSIKITHKMEIIPIIQYWLPRLRVISPNSLAVEIEGNLKKYLK